MFWLWQQNGKDPQALVAVSNHIQLNEVLYSIHSCLDSCLQVDRGLGQTVRVIIRHPTTIANTLRYSVPEAFEGPSLALRDLPEDVSAFTVFSTRN